MRTLPILTVIALVSLLAACGQSSPYVVYEYQDGQTPATGPSGLYDTHSTATTYAWSLITDTDGGPARFTVQAVNGDGYGAAGATAAGFLGDISVFLSHRSMRLYVAIRKPMKRRQIEFLTLRTATYTVAT